MNTANGDVFLTINITSSHGLGPGNVAFVICPVSGAVLQATVNLRDLGHPVPASFDINEYRQFYGAVQPTIDIIDIGFTLPDGSKVTAEPQARTDILRQKFDECCEHLDVTLIALGKSLHSCMMLTPETRQYRKDVEKHGHAFLRRVNYNFREATDGEDYADDVIWRAPLPPGVLLSISNGGECGACQQTLNVGDKILLDHAAQECYCSRECLDQAKG